MFIHLHNHSHYSLLDGLPKIKEYIKKCVEYKMPAMALTDHGAMYGAIEFYQKAKDAGIKPIIGIETYIAPRKLIYKKTKIDDKPAHLILLAKDLVGYHNLIELATIAQLDGFYYKPRLDKEVLKKYSGGLIATSACWAGEIARALRNNDLNLAEKLTFEYKNIFGTENFYLEMVYLGENVAGQEELFEKIIALSKKTVTPLIVTKDAHYINKEDAEAQEVLLCINTGTTLSDPKRLTMREFDCSFASPELMEEKFKHLPDAIANTQKIAEQCNLELDLGKWNFPAVEIPSGKTADEELRIQAEKGLQEKIPTQTKVYQDRLNYELEVIKNKGYSPYFLTVADLINWARTQGIVVTTRGSAAGSLVSYCIGIITIDPIKFKLPFERFLNPFRPTPPDIDMDFADNRREELFEYAKQKYGEDRVAQICTFGTMMARGSVRDVTRVLGLPYEFGDRLSKLIPFGSQGFPMTIKKALEINQELKNIYQNDSRGKQVLDLAQKIEGCARHASVHAAGTLIAPSKITNFVPLQRDPAGRKKITQYEMKSSEAAGLLKFDFLGITNLSILGEAVKLIKKIKNIEVDINNLPLDDKETFTLLSHGQTIGLFQLGGSAMTKHLIDLKPTNIFDIMAMVALYRPGPMESIPEFIRRKHNPSSITYLDPRLKDILDMSYGIITYQDDVLLIAINLAGYTWEEADKFRKAMGKKIPAEMAAQEEKFKTGCQKNNLSKEKTDELWQLITPFAAYGFNKAHAASYGLVAYQTAYLKAHWPAEFLTAVLTMQFDEPEKIAATVQEAKKMNIQVLPPDINESFHGFTYVSDQTIRFGLLAIKNLGSDIITFLIKERQENGKFVSLEDLLNRVHSRNLNKKSLEALAKSGALDSLIERNMVVENIDQILNYIKNGKKDQDSKQFSLFNFNDQGVGPKKLPPLNLKPVAAAIDQNKLAWEKELLGLYVSSHPFSAVALQVNGAISTLTETKNKNDGEKILGLGLISNVKKIFTKKNELMLFVTIEDMTTSMELIVFPSVFKKTELIWEVEKFIAITGRISSRDEEAKIIVENGFNFTIEETAAVIQKLQNTNSYNNTNAQRQFYNHNTPHFNQPIIRQSVEQYLQVTLPRFFDSIIHNQIKEVFLNSPGETQVNIIVNHNGACRKIETNYKISYNENIKMTLEKMIGQNSVELKFFT
ncbi:MAG TPA: DNA polymerase III subunit alpha [bacterium]|nr:DNA polymerase III subunit alpha [bacterium]